MTKENDNNELQAIKNELLQLQIAHRVFTAQHLALFQTCKVMFGASNMGMAERSRWMTEAYDATNVHMDKHGFDNEYQAEVRKAFDELHGQFRGWNVISGHLRHSLR